MGLELVIVAVSLHRDKRSPHVQAVVVPIRDGKLGWCRVRDAAAARLTSEVKATREVAVDRGEDAPDARSSGSPHSVNRTKRVTLL